MSAANENTIPRWNAEIRFKDKGGRELAGMSMPIEEVAQLHDLVEAGPEWQSGMTIDIRLTYEL